MGFVSWIVLGLIAGAIARWIMPGSGPRGCLITILLGIGGAVVGGFIATQLGYGRVDKFDFSNLAISTGGAILILWIYRMTQKQ